MKGKRGEKGEKGGMRVRTLFKGEKKFRPFHEKDILGLCTED